MRLLAATLGFVAVAVVAAAQPSVLIEVKSVPISAPAAAMRAELDQVWRVLGPQPAAYWASKSNTEIARLRDDAQRRVIALGESFLREHPQDPLRWEAVLRLSLLNPQFILGFKPGLDAAGPEVSKFAFYIMDGNASAAWKQKAADYAEQLRQAPDVPWEIREQRLYLDLVPVVRSAAMDGPRQRGAAEKQIDRFALRFPEGSRALELYLALFNRALREGGPLAEEIWGRLTAGPNRSVTERALAELRRTEARRQPLELAFTAVDGRAVDLAQLRGKVVLVDFWATWCGPCIAELPNVKKVYAAYHDRGFEVVGISLENPKYAKDDTPAQRAEKLAKARQVLMDFTAKQGMPWPQHFDGEWWQNPIAKRHAVNAIPAMFLLDPDGKVVSTNARGELLEKEVKRLLKL